MLPWRKMISLLSSTCGFQALNFRLIQVIFNLHLSFTTTQMVLKLKSKTIYWWTYRVWSKPQTLPYNSQTFGMFKPSTAFCMVHIFLTCLTKFWSPTTWARFWYLSQLAFFPLKTHKLIEFVWIETGMWHFLAFKIWIQIHILQVGSSPQSNSFGNTFSPNWDIQFSMNAIPPQLKKTLKTLLPTVNWN